MSKIPKLRFKEFSENWELKKIKDIAIDMIQGVNTAIDIPEYVDDGIPMLKANDIIDGSIKFNNVEHISMKSFNSYNNRFRAKKYDFLFSNIGARLGTGSLLLKDIDCSFAWNVMRIIPNNLIHPFYMYFRINSNLFFKYVQRNQSGSGMNFVPKKTLQELPICIPSMKEQEKIASFLTSFDTKIEQLTKKETLLKEYKKGVMQKIFNQEIRFKDDESKLRTGNLIDFGSFYYGKGAPKTSVTKDAKTPCVRYGELYSTYKESIKEIKSYTNVNPNNLKLSKGGEVLVPRVGENPLDFANCSYLPFENVAIGEMISVYNTEENGLYITYYINAMLKKQLAQFVEGGNVSNLYFRYVEKIEITIPSYKEQTKIVDFLSSIDDKIEQTKIKLEKTKEFKKALLQQMFV